MGDVTTWSPTAAGNDLNPPGPPDYPSENQSRSSINNCIRENMSAVRRLADDGGWFDHGHTYAFVGANQFQAQNGDFTATYLATRSVRAVGISTGTIYGIVTDATFSSPHTTVTVAWTSGQLQNESLTISVGVDPRAVSPDGVEIGDAKLQIHGAIKSNYLEASGQTLNKTDYPQLDALLSADSYPYGSDATTFNLPNYNGRSVKGRGQGNTAEGGGAGSTFALGDADGAETHTLTVPELPTNNKSVRDPTATGPATSGPLTLANATNRTENFGGSDQPHNNESPYAVGVWVIKVLP